MNVEDKNRLMYKPSLVQPIFRILLGVFLLLAGIGHLSVLRQEFLAQVPTWLPVDGDLGDALGLLVEDVAVVGAGRGLPLDVAAHDAPCR